MTDSISEENEQNPDDVSALKQELIEAKVKAQENLDAWKLEAADSRNLKARLNQEKIDAIKYANADLIRKIIPVHDDFERAIDAVPEAMVGEAWVDGINGIERKLFAILESVGVTRIKARGELFDPSQHEAVGSVPGAEGMVIRELEKGYKLNGRLLRPSRVLVGNGEDETESSEE